MDGRRRMRGFRALALGTALATWVAGNAAQASAAEEATRVEPVVVTATRIEEPVSAQASSTSVVTRETIETTNPPLAGDALKNVPGLDVQRSGTPGNRENVKIRGSLGTHTLVLVDGFPVNSPTLGQYDISSLPVDQFEQVEVVRGAQSALYGSNAIGGVVNFIPRRAEGREAGAASSGGSHDTLKWSGFAREAGRAGSLHLGATGLESRGILENDGTSIASFLGSGEIGLGRRGTLHGIVLTTDSDKEIPIDFGSPRDINHEASRRGVLSGARWESSARGPFSLTASGSYFREVSFESDPADPGEAFPFIFDDRTITRKTTLGVRGRYAPGKRSVTFAGFEYIEDYGADTLHSNFGDTAVASSIYNRAFYIQEELRFSERGGASVGARLDRNSTAGTEFNPKAAAFVGLPGGVGRVRAAVGRGFRVPTISETADPTIGNAGLSPEVVVSYEAGTDLQLPAKRGTLSAVWFYQDFSDLIQFDSSVPGPVGFGQLRNVGHAFSRGVESEASLVLLPGAVLGLVYTYSDTWDASRGQRIVGIPTHRGTASLDLSPGPAWTCRLDWHVEGDQIDAPPNGGDPLRPGYARVDVFARYRWELPSAEVREVALSGSIRNLLDREYEERKGFPAPGIGFLLGAEVRI